MRATNTGALHASLRAALRYIERLERTLNEREARMLAEREAEDRREVAELRRRLLCRRQ